MEYRNNDALSHIIEYCDDAAFFLSAAPDGIVSFRESKSFRYSVSMCILQIGELAGKLTDDFKAKYNGIPWKAIIGMRNVMAHGYGNISIEQTWITALEDLPALRLYCISIHESTQEDVHSTDR